MHDNGGLQMAARLKGFEMPTWLFVTLLLFSLPVLIELFGVLLCLVISAITKIFEFIAWLFNTLNGSDPS